MTEEETARTLDPVAWRAWDNAAACKAEWVTVTSEIVERCANSLIAAKASLEP